MSITYTTEDLRIQPADQEATASDMKIVARNAKLAGHFSVMEGEVRPGEILAFHTHQNEDQHMYIIEGELHFEVGGAGGLRFTARAGDHVLKPRGSSHGFWNPTKHTARYIETSTQDGFERFVDARAEGISTMIGGAAESLGMSFEHARTLEVMKEFELDGMAGANLSDPQALLRDPGLLELLRTDAAARELIFYLGGAKLESSVKGLLGRLDPRARAGAC
ncbi:cupin domain-containing protein [Pseudenhygromyxa sp. WMMC2535]|uniref:cupin domain-containing protein n=1 Tax=Pseudenhygromyxa sp. WMMC2535 TaxID=2712867 RepID=UPI0015541356|nr:cupin domain-containing protein [Pseudenhygromyxa sp. WMMC2535]NVB37663.1 cupin domain-containing protein [Pseudenhygromyxa sp. WMMC2535]